MHAGSETRLGFSNTGDTFTLVTVLTDSEDKVIRFWENKAH